MFPRLFKRRDVYLLCAALWALPAHAKPNFSGHWRMVADRSDFGPMPAPEKFEQQIEHRDPQLKLKFTQVGQRGEITSELTYNTEGKETTNEIRGNPVKSTARWDGDALVVESKVDLQGNEVTLSDRWALEQDGRVLVLSRRINGPQGEVEQKIVFEKQ